MHHDDVRNLPPGQRLSQIASILATGLLRLKTARSVPKESINSTQNSDKKALELYYEKRRHVVTGYRVQRQRKEQS